MVTGVISYTLRLVGRPVKSRRKVAQKDRLIHTRSLYTWVVCVSKIAIRKKCIRRKFGKLGSNHTVMFSKTTMRPVKIRGKEGSIAGNHSKVRTSGAKFKGSPIRGKNERRNRETGAVRPQRTLGNWQRMSINSNRCQKICSTLVPKLG